MKLKRIMIAAPKSGSGKTTITCALLQVLKNMGVQPVSYKCGPDYIDPMFHEKVIGVPSKNLDTFFTGEEKTKTLFLVDRKEKDFAVLEGVMGLYDGLGGVREEGSTYHLAKITKTPIILVVDAKGMGRSVIPLLAGFLKYDNENLIFGVILNRMSKSYYEVIKHLIEEELNISVLGYFPEQKELQIKNRHLGLVMPHELKNIKEQLQLLSKELEKTVLIEKIIQIAENTEELHRKNKTEKKCIVIRKSIPKETISSELECTKFMPLIAVAKDEAFCFYYEDNLRLIKECGAKIEYFSPLHDKKLPEGCNAILLGGGYPELYAKELEENDTMRAIIKQAVEQGMPAVAECGGFMYLHSAIVDKEQKRYAMVGVIPSICSDTGKLVRFGYIELQEKQSRFLPEGERIRGHEFHYYDSTDNGCDCLVTKPVTGKTYLSVMEGEHYWFGFPHLYYPSNPNFAKCFVDKARKYTNKRK